NPAQPIELRAGLFRAIARQHLDVLDRHEEAIVAGIKHLQAIMRRTGNIDRLERLVAADAMLGMDDEIAGGERPRLGDEIPEIAACRPALRSASRYSRTASNRLALGLARSVAKFLAGRAPASKLSVPPSSGAANGESRTTAPARSRSFHSASSRNICSGRTGRYSGAVLRGWVARLCRAA